MHFMHFMHLMHFRRTPMNGFQRNVFLRFLKLTSLCFLGFSKSTGVSYKGVSYNRILSVVGSKSVEKTILQQRPLGATS